MKLTELARLALLTVAGTLGGSAEAADVTYQTLYAATANDVIDDMLIAQRTHTPTKIRLAPGRYIFSTRKFNSTYDPSLLPMVSTTIQIIGRDPATTSFELDQNAGVLRFFIVLRTGNLSIFNLTLKGGRELCWLNDCSKLGGGVAYNAGGELDFHNCVLSGNSATAADGSQFGGGGAILNLAGHFLLDRTTVTDNEAETYGGAIAMLGGTGSIWNSIISSNRAFPGSGRFVTTVGGGIFVSGDANLFVSGSTVSGNSLGMNESYNSIAFGGGIYNNGITTLIDSSANENHVAPEFPRDGTAPGSGGGIFNGGRMSIRNSTIGGNTVGTLGGGIYNSGSLAVQGVTITANSVAGENGDLQRGGFPLGCSYDAPQLCVSGGGGIWNEPNAKLTIIQSAVGGNDKGDCNGSLVSKGHNAIGNSLNCPLIASAWLGGRPTHDIVNLNLGLGDLQDDGIAGNGHYPPLADSPLIDAGGNVGVFCTTADQIGQRRVKGNADNDGPYICDIGAIEYQPPRH